MLGTFGSFRGPLTIGAAFLVLMTGIAEPAGAQSSSEMLDRINQLENQVQTLSRAVYRGDSKALQRGNNNVISAEPLPAPDAAGYEVRINDLESRLRELTGQIERQTHEIDQMKTRLDKALTDMELRMNNAGGSSMAQTRPVEPSVPRLAPPVSSGGGGTLGSLSSSGGGEGAEQLYESAFALVREGRYDDAEKKFQSFLDRFDGHALASNAQYWLAETFYVRGNYQQSARLFAQGYQKYPKSSKAADNLLKMGLSLAKMGKKDDACLSFNQLQKEFAGDTGPVMRRVVQEKKSLGCE